jgi:hypothetical protein
MNSPRNLLTLLLLAAAAASAPAHALTRAQVEAQLAAAQRNGTVVGKLGVTDRQLRPWLYPPAAGAGQTRAVAAGPSSWRAGALTRAQVKSELALAIRNGDMLAPGESGLTERQLDPALYARQAALRS